MIVERALPRLALALLAACVAPAVAQPGCRTQTAYNPISEDYPLSVTGVANGTFSLVPIGRDVAASLLPEGFGLLDDDAYRGEIGFWNEDSFPLLVRAVYVHDIRAPDDMWRNDHTLVSFEIPFVDALGDGETPFRFAYAQFIATGTPSHANDVAELYGVPHIVRSVYEPECDAYQRAGDPRNESYLRVIPADGSMRNVELLAPMQLTKEARPFGAELLAGIINQPRAGVGEEGPVCGRTTVLVGEDVGFEGPVQTKGEILVSDPTEGLDVLLEGASGWESVYGIRVGTAFVDEDFVDCSSLAAAG